jgi:hypothetical protein
MVCSLPDALLDAVAEVGVDVAPVVEGASQYRFADSVGEVASDVVHQAFSLGVVHHVADQGAASAAFTGL